jgi:hypothetical protein
VFNNRLLRRIFGYMRKWWEAGEEHIMGSFTNCTLHQVLFRSSNQGG